ncbi:unnamed protein product [Dimorphilus gyrociliatus]|uniref:CRAL-TRIO domain-containing protein n=1 Tax=Dimorphilus gyrociliatus TaxID=2664684 RepID=A0A7I8V8W3_9ANNE|nr:unnamed protein product [Dimorphilus gyrociliatus]
MEQYTCSFENDPFTLEKAKKEVYEIPSDRLAAVDCLRQWLNSQEHLVFKADTRMLLAFLRHAKFSQKKARETLEGYVKNFDEYPCWFRDLDPCSKKTDWILSKGYGIPLPGYDVDGRKVIFYKISSIPYNEIGKGKTIDVDDLMKVWVILGAYANSEERTQIHGFSLFFDYTNVTMKQLGMIGRDKIKEWNTATEDRLTGRLKAFQMYNIGALFEVMFNFIKPFMKKKFLNRIYVYETLEEVYKNIDKKNLPSEYLPDDYDGPTQGTFSEMAAKFKKEIQSEEWRKYYDSRFNSSFHVDNKKKNNGDAPTALFRKLNVD